MEETKARDEYMAMSAWMGYFIGARIEENFDRTKLRNLSFKLHCTTFR